MKNSIYQESKRALKFAADEAKRLSKNSSGLIMDKPYINQVINDNCDDLQRQINFYAMRETISEKQAALYCNWLSSYACKLHPSN